MDSRPFLEEDHSTVSKAAHFIGKLIGLGILLSAGVGLLVILLATVGCSRPTALYLAKTQLGNYCVEAQSYTYSGACVSFYNLVVPSIALSGPEYMTVATFCGQVVVSPTTREFCQMTAAAPVKP